MILKNRFFSKKVSGRVYFFFWKQSTHPLASQFGLYSEVILSTKGISTCGISAGTNMFKDWGNFGAGTKNVDNTIQKGDIIQWGSVIDAEHNSRARGCWIPCKYVWIAQGVASVAVRWDLKERRSWARWGSWIADVIAHCLVSWLGKVGIP